MLLLFPHFKTILKAFFFFFLRDQWHKTFFFFFFCTTRSVTNVHETKNCHFEDKVELFSLSLSPLCSKYQWEYACNNIQRITLSASRCNKMHTWVFWLSFFVVFSRRVTEVTMYFVHEDDFFSLSHCFKNVFSDSSFLCDVNHFSHVGWRAMFKRVLMFFQWSVSRVYMSPPHLIWDTQLGSLFPVSIFNG